jgi:hypothetical protein
LEEFSHQDAIAVPTDANGNGTDSFWTHFRLQGKRSG